MSLILSVLFILLIIYLPGAWVRYVLKKYSKPIDRYSGTGAELAKYLLDQYKIKNILVEETKYGDHYDPITKTVRLSKQNFYDRSLTAITVAAHEVGHAVQDNENYKPLRYRTHLVKIARRFEKLGAGILMLAPFMGILTRIPGLGLLMFLGGLLSLGTSTIVHLITLPTEIDASFNKALPMLKKNNILKPSDPVHAKRILRAAALTYISASLSSLLNIARWIAILRR